MAEAGEAEDFEKLTIAQLKERLRELGKPVGGNKAALVARMQAAAKEGEEASAASSDALIKPQAKSSAAAAAAAYEASMKGQAEGTQQPAKSAEADAVEEVLQNQEPWDASLPDLEDDAPADARARLRETIGFQPSDATLNVMPSHTGGFLMAVSQGGTHSLLAGARGSVGMAKGRYMFEATIVENVGGGWQLRGEASRHVLRVGFSTGPGVPIMGDDDSSICYESTGTLMHNKTTKKVNTGFERGRTAAVVLNLSGSGEADNSISLFVDGKRVAKPQKLPKSLVGKTLFPTLTFRGVSVHVNFGPEPRVPLTFICRTLQDAAKEDVVLPQAKDGAHEVLFPICMPDEGGFDWLDWYKENHPEIAEISDRSISAWAVRSGIRKKPHQKNDMSADRPDMAFEISEIEDGQAKTNLTIAASVQKRTVVVMELRANLISEERKLQLKKFCSPHCKKVALIAVGHPPDDFKKWRHALLLKDKKAKAETEHQVRVKEAARKRVIARAKRKAAGIKRRMEREAASKRREEERRHAEEQGLPPPEFPEEEEPEEDDGDKSEEEEEVPPAPEVQLTEQEKSWPFPRPGRPPDVAANVLPAALTKMSLPTLEEGFDEIRYAWSDEAGCADYLKMWASTRKQNTRMEDIKPSAQFEQKKAQWKQDLQKWHLKRLEWDDPAKRSALLAAANARAAAESSDSGQGWGAKRMKFSPDDPDPLRTLEECDEAEPEEDVFGVEDVCDHKGKPLFADFEYADWALLTLRFELHLLIRDFVKTCKDPDRTGVHPDHLAFYYGRYWKKGLNPKLFGCETVRDLLSMIRDTVIICRIGKVLESQLGDDLESNGIFVKLAEACRQERQRRLDAGDESARLQVPPPVGPAALAVAPNPKSPPHPVAASKSAAMATSVPKGAGCGGAAPYGKAAMAAGKGCGKMGKMGKVGKMGKMGGGDDSWGGYGPMSGGGGNSWGGWGSWA